MFGWCEGSSRGDQAFIPMGGPWVCVLTGMDFVCTEVIEMDNGGLGLQDVFVFSGAFTSPTRASMMLSIASTCEDEAECGEQPLPCDWETTFDMERSK